MLDHEPAPPVLRAADDFSLADDEFGARSGSETGERGLAISERDERFRRVGKRDRHTERSETDGETVADAGISRCDAARGDRIGFPADHAVGDLVGVEYRAAAGDAADEADPFRAGKRHVHFAGEILRVTEGYGWGIPPEEADDRRARAGDDRVRPRASSHAMFQPGGAGGVHDESPSNRRDSMGGATLDPVSHLRSGRRHRRRGRSRCHSGSEFR